MADAHGVTQPIPSHVTMKNGEGISVPPHRNAFVITWFNSYTLYVKGIECMVLNHPKEQAILAPSGVPSGLV